MVIYRGVDGKPGYHQTDDIHDAVNFVEQMRNEEGVEHARIFRLEEVVFEYRPYYRVELTNDSLPANSENGTAQIAESNGGKVSAQVGSGTEEVDLEEVAAASDSTDSADDGDGADGADDNGEVKADAGAKKGLFGR
jgi:hypothetical protein